jgi:hypothetical protein
MRVEHKDGRLQVRPRLVAQPADDRHAAIVAVVVDAMLAAQVMVEVHVIPRFARAQRPDALHGRLDSDRLGVIPLELNAPRRIVVQEQNAAARRSRSRHRPPHLESMEITSTRTWQSTGIDTRKRSSLGSAQPLSTATRRLQILKEEQPHRKLVAALREASRCTTHQLR